MPDNVDQGAGSLPAPQNESFRAGFSDYSRNSSNKVGVGDIEMATIVDVIPHARCYRLQCNVRGRARGYALSSASGNTASGPNDINLYQVGTAVAVYFPMQENRGLILGAIPPFIWDNNLNVAPVIIQGSDIGISEPPFQHMLKGEDFDGQGFGVENFAAGAAADTIPGDWGTMNELGVGILVSKCLAFLRASDNCGVTAFYLDHLLRIQGYNYEHFTSAHEHRIYNDEQELHDVNFGCKFPWETLGLYEYGTSPFKHEDGQGEWKAGEKEGYYEPQKEDQTGIWRNVELRGYLGDLLREMVSVPDLGFESQPITYSDNQKVAYAGLSEITRSSNGGIGIRSAKEILLSKYVLIPVPHQKTLPDDNVNGDWRKNYKASNAAGEGAAAPDMNDFTWNPEDEGDIKPALLLEYMAWTFNFNKWENLLAHKKDWFVNEESDTIERWSIERAYIEGSKVTAMESSYWAEMPKQVDIEIDSRVKGQKYYESMSALALLDDGSVVLEDGWGSTIVMHRGNIQFCCAGDIFMRPGRSFYAFAPKDAMLRAGGSIDLTATTHDIRLKAEKNLQLLAGNDSGKSDEVGGILLESRSNGMPLNFDAAGEHVVSGGIVFKARNSDVAIWGNNLYLGTKQMDSRAAGNIMISADEGEKDILLQAKMMMRDIGTMAIDRFSSTRANFYTKSAAIIDTEQLIVRGSGFFTRGGQLLVDGTIGGAGSLVCEGSGAFGGSISDGASDPHMVAPNDGAPKGLIKPPLQAIDSTAQEAEDNVADAVELVDKSFQDGKPKIGSSDTIKEVNFSLRTDDDYVARDFKIFAARWQQILKDNGGSNTWEEREVTAGSITTYPFPGRGKYEGDDAFIPEIISKYFPLVDGKAVDRGEDGGVYLDRTNAEQSTAQSLNQYGTTVPVT